MLVTARTVPSMSRRRATGFAVLTLLLSFVTSLFVAAAPAHATEVDKTIGYRCSSDYGSGSSAVRIQVMIPDRIAQGVTVPGRKVRFRIRVPRELVRMMRSYGVTSVSATGRAHYTIGTLKRPIRHLHIPDTVVPPSGAMTLKGSGRAASFAISQAGTYKVKVTKSLTATATAHGGAFGGSSVGMSCSVRRGESRTLATLQVIR